MVGAFELGVRAELVCRGMKVGVNSKPNLQKQLRRVKPASLPQWASSAPFSQSCSLSQVQLWGMQRPLGQAKKGVGHFALLLPERQKESSNEISIALTLNPNCETESS